MALVNVVNMSVLDNPTCFLNPFQFEITFECLQELDDDLEWKVLYVGSAHDSQYDQILDEILVGPIPVGLNKFVLQADAPNITQLLQQPNITSDDILGVTVVLVTCSYKEREFVRIGYYVNNEYDTGDDTGDGGASDVDGVDTTTPTAAAATTIQSPEPDNHHKNDDDDAAMTNQSTPPPPPSRQKISIYDIDFHKVQRQILADKPRVTKFPIPWNHPTSSMVTSTDVTSATQSQLPSKPQHLLPPPLSSTPSTIGTTVASEDDMMMDAE